MSFRGPKAHGDRPQTAEVCASPPACAGVTAKGRRSNADLRCFRSAASVERSRRLGEHTLNETSALVRDAM
jgi:hypothetical protein